MKRFIPPDGDSLPPRDEDAVPPLEPPLSGGEIMGASPGKGFPSKLIPIEVPPPHVVMLRGIGWDSNIYLVRDGEEAL